MSLLWNFGFFSTVLLDLRHRATLVAPWPAPWASVRHALLLTPFSSSFFAVDVILEPLVQVDAGSQLIYCQKGLKRFNASQCGNFFTYKIAPIWNRLPAEAVNSASVKQFKIDLDKVIDTLF